MLRVVLVITVLHSQVMFTQWYSLLIHQDLSIKTADAHGSTVILATDPDADRLALAEKQPKYVTTFFITIGTELTCSLEHTVMSYIIFTSAGIESASVVTGVRCCLCICCVYVLYSLTPEKMKPEPPAITFDAEVTIALPRHYGSQCDHTIISSGLEQLY